MKRSGKAEQWVSRLGWLLNLTQGQVVEGGRRELDQRLEVVFVLGKLAERRRKKKGGQPDVLPVGTRAKRGQAMGNNWFSLNSKKLNFGRIGTEMAGVATAGEDEAFSDEKGQAFEREAQSLPNFSPLNVAKMGCN